MRIVRKFTLHEVMDILAQHMGGGDLRRYKVNLSMGTVDVVEVECETYPEHDPYSDVMGWCARNLAADNELRRCSRPNFAAAMWAGVRKAELLRQAMDDKRRERDDRLRAAEARLKPLGPFAAGHILAAIREVAR
ncbi:hypothetical protein [Burkholderia multivorans]|uniref:hypothetical protein n=1 Tax=Burkholderia multivorans TaxID=87883 RepID=UPI0021BF8DEE|nr:hypothetical protein [Burkholderia multivorans]